MGLRPVKVKCWENYLIHIGCEYIRTKASHYHYKCPKCKRTITFAVHGKELPGLYISTNCRNLGISVSDVYNWITNNC